MSYFDVPKFFELFGLDLSNLPLGDVFVSLADSGSPFCSCGRVLFRRVLIDFPSFVLYRCEYCGSFVLVF